MSLLTNISLWMISKKESSKFNKQFLNWTQLSNILIIAYDNQLSNIVDFINICKKDNISVQVAIIYDGKPELGPKPHFDHIILNRKQFGFFKIPKDNVIAKLSSEPLDVLINLGTSEKIKTLALSKMIPAKCKISSFQNENFDLIIDADKSINTSDYLKQVIVYLNMIKTTK